MKKRIVSISVLPGEPTDGKGRVCIHLFVPDPHGPFTEPSVMRQEAPNPEQGDNGLRVGPVRGRLACDSKMVRKVAPVERNGVTSVTMRTDDPRAVTCPKCKATQVYADMTKIISDAEASR